MDASLFELIILSSGGLLGGGGRSHGYSGGWGRLHTPSQDPPAGWGLMLIEGVSRLSNARALKGHYVQEDFSELGTVCFLGLKTPS